MYRKVIQSLIQSYLLIQFPEIPCFQLYFPLKTICILFASKLKMDSEKKPIRKNKQILFVTVSFFVF